MSFNENDNTSNIILNREIVQKSYDIAIIKNKKLFKAGNPRGTEKYIFPNQKEDALNIVNIFDADRNIVVVSITKRTKVGMDGLMIEIAKLFCTHSDDNFVIDPNNVRFITGMSNKSWQEDFKEKVPSCFENNIFHHGQLHNSNIVKENSLIIIDEIDSGDGEWQVLHRTLHDADITNVNLLKQNNTKLIVVSATMLVQLRELFKWGDLHKNYQMTIPPNYISQMDFLEKEIINDFYPIHSIKDAERWIKEDIINNYKTDYRIHIIRLNKNNIQYIRAACQNNNILFKEHTSDERLSTKEENEYFMKSITQHIVLGVKGFFRRANLIPNDWKLRIGAVHELHTKLVNINVQIQGLPGRMTGYWKDVIEKGHKTGPYRTSIQAIKDYEKIIKNPLNNDVKLNIDDDTFVKPKNFNIHKDKIVNITTKSIPIKLVILDNFNLNVILNKLKKLKGTNANDFKECIQILKSGIDDKNIIMTDHNNKDNNIISFSFDDPYYKKVYIRKCTSKKSAKNYRFDSFLNSHNNSEPYSQEIKKDSFSLDIIYIDDYDVDGKNIPKGTAFISYELRPVKQNITEQPEQNVNISS